MAIRASPIVGSGMGFDHAGAARARSEQGTWTKAFDKYADSPLELMGMANCDRSTSPKLGKQRAGGDEGDLKDPGVYHSTVCTLL